MTERRLDFVDAEMRDGNQEVFLAFRVEKRSMHQKDAPWTVDIRGCYYATAEKVYVYDMAAKKFVEPAAHPKLQTIIRKALTEKPQDAPAGACEKARDLTI